MFFASTPFNIYLVLSITIKKNIYLVLECSILISDLIVSCHWLITAFPIQQFLYLYLAHSLIGQTEFN